MTELFPSILPNGEDFSDDTYLRAELESKPYAELQSIAATHPSDDVHGRMDRETLLEELTGLQRV